MVSSSRIAAISVLGRGRLLARQQPRGADRAGPGKFWIEHHRDVLAAPPKFAEILIVPAQRVPSRWPGSTRSTTPAASRTGPSSSSSGAPGERTAGPAAPAPETRIRTQLQNHPGPGTPRRLADDPEVRLGDPDRGPSCLPAAFTLPRQVREKLLGIVQFRVALEERDPVIRRNSGDPP